MNICPSLAPWTINTDYKVKCKKKNNADLISIVDFVILYAVVNIICGWQQMNAHCLIYSHTHKIEQASTKLHKKYPENVQQDGTSSKLNNSLR